MQNHELYLVLHHIHESDNKSEAGDVSTVQNYTAAGCAGVVVESIEVSPWYYHTRYASSVELI